MSFLGDAQGEPAGGLQPALVHAGQTALPGAGREQHRRGLRVDVSRSVPTCPGSMPPIRRSDRRLP